MTRADRYRFEWTDHVFICCICGLPSRVARKALESAVKAALAEVPEPDLMDTLAGFDTCISCVAGLEVPGEHVDSAASVG